MRSLIAVPVVLVLLLSGCAEQEKKTAQLEVVAAAYPFAWLAEQVGGPTVKVTNLVKPGAEPHEVELSPRQVVQVRRARVLVYLKGFQPAVDDALGSSAQGLDLGASVPRTEDPHIWLDPVRMQAAAKAIEQRLIAIDPAHAKDYAAQALAVTDKLIDLDRAFTRALETCARREIVTSHSAFGYLAERYRLVQRGISGLSPDAEPSPGRMAEVASYARANGVTTIFFESLVDPKVAKTLAAEIGAKTAVLDPIEGVSGTDDYLSVQLRNARALRDALACR